MLKRLEKLEGLHGDYSVEAMKRGSDGVMGISLALDHDPDPALDRLESRVEALEL
jgi:hypothetical protein